MSQNLSLQTQPQYYGKYQFTEMSIIYSMSIILFITQNFTDISCEHDCTNFEGKCQVKYFKDYIIFQKKLNKSISIYH